MISHDSYGVTRTLSIVLAMYTFNESPLTMQLLKLNVPTNNKRLA